MSSTTEIKQAVAQVKPAHPLKVLLEKSVKEIGRALPSGMNPERVVRIALTCITQNPQLAECTPESFMGSLFVLAQLGLEPIAGRAYLLPFNNERKIGDKWETKKEVQAIIGYKGFADLFYRHDSALSIDMQVVCQNDQFDYEYGTRPFLKHKPATGERGEVIGYYAVAILKGNATVFRYMTKEDCMNHGKTHSKTWDKKKNEFYPSSPWAKEGDAMCQKTVLLQLAKILPLSVETQKAISVDETSRDYREGIVDVIDLPSVTAWEEEGHDPVIPKVEPKTTTSIPGGLE
jgi:recombination protein RecT